MEVLSSFDLTGKVAVVTGGTGHLGSAFCEALAEAGAVVVVTSRDASRAAEAAARLRRKGQAAHYGVQLDHLEEASINSGFAEILRLAGRVDILVNNGIDQITKDWTNVTGDEFNRHLKNNTGYFLLSRLVRNHAVERGGPASIIMLGSLYGQVGSYPDVYEGITFYSQAPYHALKGGTLQMTRHLAVYWAKDGVRVNTLSPGAFPNTKKAPAELVRRLNAKIPMGRVGDPRELKGALVFLASDASLYVTGQNLTVDGGFTAW